MALFSFESNTSTMCDSCWRDARVYAQVATPGLRLRRVRMYEDNGHAETKPGEARREAKA
jgi:hypothetical protein